MATSNRKSAARMRTRRDETESNHATSDNGRKGRKTGNEHADVTYTVTNHADDGRIGERVIPKASVDDLDRINAGHRSPVAMAIRRWRLGAGARQVCRMERRNLRTVRSAKRHIAHPNAMRNALFVAIVAMFVTVAGVSMSFGMRHVPDAAEGSDVNEVVGVDTVQTTTTRQRRAIMATGTYSRYMLYEGFTTEALLDGHVTPPEQTAYQRLTEAYQAREKAKADAYNESLTENENANANDTDGNAHTNAETNTFTDGNGTSSGTLTSDQENTGRSIVNDAVNKYREEQTANTSQNIIDSLNPDSDDASSR